ncbi:MAG: hypothetical protein JNL32_04420 [Candidatus Kapabacteria bacterium]|nr:hypothetical protein [Candidatus Kapabacteria bacterium]
MSLLIEYLHTLTQHEKQTLRGLNLTKRERDVMDVALDHSEETHEQQRKALGISAGNWDKLQSVLLRKCYTAMIPDGGVKLIHHLSARYTLSKHLYKEVIHQRKTLYPSLPLSEQRAYCESLLTVFLSMPLYNSNEKLLLHLLREYIAILPRTERAVQQSIYTSQIHSARISRLAGAMTLQKDRTDKKMERTLLNEYDDACILSSPKAQVYADIALYDYYAAIESDMQINHIERATRTSEQIADFRTFDKQQIHTKYATALYQVLSDVESAQREYGSLFHLYPESKNNIYPAAKYIQVCLILSRYDDAKAMLKGTFAPLLNHSRHTIAANAALNYAKYHTMVRDYPAALEMIHKGMTLLKKKLYVQYEIEFRNLQTAVFVMQNDREVALATIERNLKYLRSKGFKSSNSDFHEFYTLLRDYILSPEQFTPDETHQRIIDKWSNGIYNIYGALVKNIIQTKRRHS